MLLGILECGRNKPEWLADHGGFADWFPPLLGPVAPALRYEVWRADQMELPERVERCDAWLLTGSPRSVYQDLPWQIALTGFVQRAAGVRPIVGICYGHQHLHHALGGTVAKRSEWGVGVQDYPIVHRPDWLGEPAAVESEALDLIALHQDHVKVPAPGTRVLAARPDCPLAVTQIGANALTFQPHPEMMPAQAALIYDLHRQAMGEEHFTRATASLERPLSTRQAAEWIVRFLAAKSQGDRP